MSAEGRASARREREDQASSGKYARRTYDRGESLRRALPPDERALIFGPLGIGGPAPADVAARYQAAVIEQARLSEIIPESIRMYFERVRQLHLYGVLEYEFFSAACDLSLFAIEGALRVRFVEHYGGRIPVAAKGRTRPAGPQPTQARAADGIHETLAVTNFDDVWKAARSWQLRPVTGGETTQLPTNLDGLLAWARREKLLPGRRSRFVDQGLARLRDMAAHPTQYSLQMPPESARSVVHPDDLRRGRRRC